MNSFTVMAAMGCGLEKKYYVGVPILNIAGFYICTWQTYHTRSLVLGYFNGPTEGILFACFIYLVSGIFGNNALRFCFYSLIYYDMYCVGPDFWQTPVSIHFLADLSETFPASMSLLDVFYATFFILFTAYLFPSV
jgi:hypothetical protein